MWFEEQQRCRSPDLAEKLRIELEAPARTFMFLQPGISSLARVSTLLSIPRFDTCILRPIGARRMIFRCYILIHLYPSWWIASFLTDSTWFKPVMHKLWQQPKLHPQPECFATSTSPAARFQLLVKRDAPTGFTQFQMKILFQCPKRSKKMAGVSFLAKCQNSYSSYFHGSTNHHSRPHCPASLQAHSSGSSTRPRDPQGFGLKNWILLAFQNLRVNFP